MSELETACTIEGLFEKLYTSAVVPVDAKPMLNVFEFNRLMDWQRVTNCEDGPGVLTAEKLTYTTPIVMMALQTFAFKRMCAHPNYEYFVAHGALDDMRVDNATMPEADPVPDEDPDAHVDNSATAEADAASQDVTQPDKDRSDEVRPLRFNTAEAYIEYDLKQNLEHYNKYNRQMRQSPPDRAWFPTYEVYKAALDGRTMVCTKPTHVGSRALYPGDFYTNAQRICKQCQRKVMRKATAVYETAEAWQAAHENARNETPKEDEFPDKSEYERAVVMHQERRKVYKREHAKAQKRAREA